MESLKQQNTFSLIVRWLKLCGHALKEARVGQNSWKLSRGLWLVASLKDQHYHIKFFMLSVLWGLCTILNKMCIEKKFLGSSNEAFFFSKYSPCYRSGAYCWRWRMKVTWTAMIKLGKTGCWNFGSKLKEWFKPLLLFFCFSNLRLVVCFVRGGVGVSSRLLAVLVTFTVYLLLLFCKSW